MFAIILLVILEYLKLVSYFCNHDSGGGRVAAVAVVVVTNPKNNGGNINYYFRYHYNYIYYALYDTYSTTRMFQSMAGMQTMCGNRNAD